MVKIMIADDQELVRLGLKNLLTRQPDWEVVAEAATVTEAVSLAAEHQPDVAVMDVQLGAGNGLDACRQITKTYPSVKVIILTALAGDDWLFNAISAGAVGYVLKRASNDDLVRAIQAVIHSGAMLDPGVTGPVLAKIRQFTHSEAFIGLTDKELKILLFIARGLTNREIAEKLHLGGGTVRNYVSAIFSKLGLSNRAEATAYAISHQLEDYIDLPEA